ncbi:LysR family transcriptional regulator [Pseudomonas sp. 5P_3.1_Bac2]|uniref:LysR family transcriptional regulator n=1 Tax=Pseudomonas sp. 5P_3.1_Bac2 TaxID=2971617 RepID=UPI0021C577D3|nr:LysR family transcriptional regulator [Pseudomonas sp. 5P_3.1_Bac2]MCU1717270.1 LysR family transcriptional regulator [Pseudomonas sp. 5P_3.1_Bac2]
MDRLQGMAVFVKAADLGSFAAAGAALDMSAQMVGKHVSAIEERLGTRLLNRTTRRQSLTDLGRQYYERCKTVLAEVEAAETIAHTQSSAPRGRLRVNAPVTFGTYCLMPVIAQYLKTYPDVQVDLTLSDRVVDLIEEGYEAVIRIGTLADSSLMARTLKPYRLIVCAAPEYLQRRGTPTTPAQLANHDCLGFAYTARPPAKQWPFMAGENLLLAQVHNRLQVNDSRAQLAAAREGIGIILGAEMMLAEDLRSGRLQRLLSDYETPAQPVHILFPSARSQTPKLRSFIDCVVQQLGG